ncbi:hypothetical protein INT47_005110 [Mucor saturninus]|uniref:Uncharacterized protein n=1 Tax=Mucor saturninus TaxID=64648 RepID=A0A8H7QUT0_9FUNG|nr:hypothetical protein INT47_005110 [Mucor saturninus]
MTCLQNHGIARSRLYQHGALVEKITICDDKHANIAPGRIIRDLARVLPNLKTIDISSSNFCKEFLYYGLNIETPTNNLNLEQLIVPQIKCVPVHEDAQKLTEIPFLYNSTCNKFRQTLKHLVIRDIESQYWFNKKDMSYSRYITQFPYLTHLTVWNNFAFKTFSGDDTTVLSIILKACPFLVSIELRNSFAFEGNCDASSQEMLALNKKIHQHETNRHNEQRLRYDITPAASPAAPPLVVTNGIPAYNTQMKRVHLVLPTISVVEMDYLMTFIPSHQLQKFELRLTRDTIDNWIERDTVTAFAFAQYLCVVPSLVFEVSNLSIDVNTKNLGPNQARKNKLLKDFIHVLLDSRRLETLRAEINVFNGRKPVKKFVNFGFNLVNHRTLKFEYALSYGDFIREHPETTKSAFLELFAGFWSCAKSNTLDLQLSYGDPTAVIKYATKKMNDVDILIVGCRKVDIRGKQYRIECNREYDEISLYLVNLNIDLEEKQFIHWAIMLPNVTFLSLENCNFPCNIQPKKKLFDRLLKLDQCVPFEYDHYTLDLTMFRKLEYVTFTLPPIKSNCKKSHTIFQTEFITGVKGRDIKFRKSSNIPKDRVVSVTDDTDLNTTYVPVRSLDRRMISIKSYKAVSVTIFNENDRGDEEKIIFG